MPLSFTPLKHRILVEPDPAPTQTASGFFIPGGDDIAAMSGTVTKLGTGPYRDLRIKAAAVAYCLNILDVAFQSASSGTEAIIVARDEMQRYMAREGDSQPDVKLGDRVLFAAEAGHEIVLDELTREAMILLAEDDILAVIEGI